MSQAPVISHSLRVRSQPGRSAELGAQLQRLSKGSRQAPGCLHFDVQVSTREPDVWWVSGFWSPASALQDWLRSPAMGVFDDLLAHALLSSMDVRTFAQTQSVPAEHVR